MSRRTVGDRYPLFAVEHIVASAAGGVGAVMFLRLLGTELGVSLGSRSSLVALGILLALALAIDLNLVKLAVPNTGAQVPGAWRRSYPPVIWVAGYGLVLGFTLLTKVSSAVVLVGMLSVAVLPTDILVPVLFGAVYGVARGSVVLREADTVEPAWYSGDSRPIGVASAIPLLVLWIA